MSSEVCSPWSLQCMVLCSLSSSKVLVSVLSKVPGTSKIVLRLVTDSKLIDAWRPGCRYIDTDRNGHVLGLQLVHIGDELIVMLLVVLDPFITRPIYDFVSARPSLSALLLGSLGRRQLVWGNGGLLELLGDFLKNNIRSRKSPIEAFVVVKLFWSWDQSWQMYWFEQLRVGLVLLPSFVHEVVRRIGP